MAVGEEADQDRTATTVPPDAVLDLRGSEPVLELSGVSPSPATAPIPAPAVSDLIEHRDSTQQARYVAVMTIAVLNAFDIGTTYLAISLGAHEGNPLVAWMISSPFAVLAKVAVCGTLIAGAVVAKQRRRRVTLPGLCMAWAVVGIYSLVVLLNTLNVLSRL